MDNFEVFLYGKLVNLVVVTRSLAENSLWYSWFNDETTTAGMQKHYFPNTSQIQAKYFEEEIHLNPTKLQLGIVTTESKSLIGMISLSQIDHLNQKCAVTGFIPINVKDFSNLAQRSQTSLLKHMIKFHIVHFEKVAKKSSDSRNSSGGGSSTSSSMLSSSSSSHSTTKKQDFFTRRLKAGGGMSDKYFTFLCS